MGLDNIINFLFNSIGLLGKEKHFEIYVNKKFVENKNANTLKIIIPPRGDGKTWITKVLIWRLHKKGNACLAYFFPKYLLSSNINNTTKLFDFIASQIKSDILKIKADRTFQKIDIIAPSLGAVSACLIANGNDDVQNIFLIVPGSCLAESLWNGIRTQKLKNTYEKQNINQERLKNIWSILAPKNNINAMGNKNIFVAISKSDKVIPYQFGKELADLLKKLYPDNTVVQENNYLGHYFTLLRYYLFSKELLK